MKSLTWFSFEVLEVVLLGGFVGLQMIFLIAGYKSCWLWEVFKRSKGKT